MSQINDSHYDTVGQNPAYSRTQLADPFRDRTHGRVAKHNRYLSFFQADATELPLLHGQHLRVQARNWRQYFLHRHGVVAERLVVEIGCYRGKNLVEMAHYFPNTAFIGVDYTFKRVALTAQRLRAAGCRNAVVVLYDAHALHLLCINQPIAGLLCFFPDPWSKRKQSHNRLWSKDFCANIINILADDACVWLKTDVASFFFNTRDNLAAVGLDQQPFPSILGCELESEFEARYRKRQRQIYAGVFGRSSCVTIFD